MQEVMNVSQGGMLGLGCMRLPTLSRDDQTSFDYELING